MPTYEVFLTVEGSFWTDVEAENEEEAEEYARETFLLSEVQSVQITDADVRRYGDA